MCVSQLSIFHTQEIPHYAVQLFLIDFNVFEFYTGSKQIWNCKPSTMCPVSHNNHVSGVMDS